MPYTIILADDHPFLLQGIASVISELPDIRIADTVNNGHDLMQRMKEHHPNLVVLDLNMPGYDGIHCLKLIKRDHPASRVLILTNYNQPHLAEEVQRLGADGFLVKNSTATELREAIEMIRQGQKVFSFGDSLKPIPEDSAFFDDFLKKYKLTRREVDIIRMIAREMSTKEIAAKCYLSELTISTHRKNIFRKLDLKNVAGLVNFAKQHNLA